MSAKPVFSPYGAFEMKVSYQKNLLIGNLSVIGLAIIIFSIFGIISLFAEPQTIIGPCWTDTDKDEYVYNRKEIIDSDRIKIVGEKLVVTIKTGVVPTMVADDEVIDDEPVVLISIDEPAVYGKDGDGDADPQNGSGGVFDGNYKIVDEIYPGESEFVPFEKEPVMYDYKKPEYPRLCKLASIEGIVIMKVLVGKDGLVKKALIAKSSGNESLDNAALEVAFDNKFSPALQNSFPIALWVTYKVEFKLQ